MVGRRWHHCNVRVRTGNLKRRRRHTPMKRGFARLFFNGPEQQGDKETRLEKMVCSFQDIYWWVCQALKGRMIPLSESQAPSYASYLV